MIKNLNKSIQFVVRRFGHDDDYIFVFEKNIITITFKKIQGNTLGYKVWLLFFLALGFYLLCINELLVALIPLACVMIFKINDLITTKHRQKYALQLNVKNKEILINSFQKKYHEKLIKKELISRFHSKKSKYSLYINYTATIFISSIFCELKTGENILLIKLYDKDYLELQKKEFDFRKLLDVIFDNEHSV